MRLAARTALVALLAACGSSPPAGPPDDGAPRFEVDVGASGYTPSEIAAPASARIHVGFRRTTDEGCGQELVIPSTGEHHDLPLDQRVWVDVTTPASGRIDFTCGMGMYRGAIVVR